MKLKRLLFEITLDMALKVLNLTKSDLSDPTKLKTAYRTASMSAHPDRGGSDEQQKDVNAAYEFLKGKVGTVSTTSSFDWEKSRKEYLELGLKILDLLKSQFKPTEFIKYFSSVYNDTFDYKILNERPKVTDRDASYAGFSVEFFNAERDIVLLLQVTCYLTDAKYDKSLGSGMGNISYSLGVTAYGLFNSKKLKLSQRDYQRTRNHDVLIDPELSFPKAKLEKFKKTSVSKVFKRADMMTYLKSKVGLAFDGDSFRLNLPDKIVLRLDRGVFMKTPYWSVSLFQNGRGVPGLGYVTLPENEETAKWFDGLVKSVKNETDGEVIKSTIKREVSEKKNTADKA